MMPAIFFINTGLARFFHLALCEICNTFLLCHIYTVNFVLLYYTINAMLFHLLTKKWGLDGKFGVNRIYITTNL